MCAKPCYGPRETGSFGLLEKRRQAGAATPLLFTQEAIERSHPALCASPACACEGLGWLLVHHPRHLQFCFTGETSKSLFPTGDPEPRYGKRAHPVSHFVNANPGVGHPRYAPNAGQDKPREVPSTRKPLSDGPALRQDPTVAVPVPRPLRCWHCPARQRLPPPQHHHPRNPPRPPPRMRP